jgi:hypothetical protein
LNKPNKYLWTFRTPEVGIILGEETILDGMFVGKCWYLGGVIA